MKTAIALALAVLAANPRPGAFPRRRVAELAVPRTTIPPDRRRPVETLIARRPPPAGAHARRAGRTHAAP